MYIKYNVGKVYTVTRNWRECYYRGIRMMAFKIMNSLLFLMLLHFISADQVSPTPER